MDSEKNKSQITDNFTKGFTQIPHSIGNLLPLLPVTNRERKVVELIIRLTYGCKTTWANLKQADLGSIRIGDTHAKKVLSGLLLKRILIKNEKTKQYSLNIKYLDSEFTKSVSPKLEKLRRLIGKQLAKDNYQNGKTELTNTVSSNLPNKEDITYLKGNIKPLPIREGLASGNNGFVTSKEILNKNIKSEINNFAISSKGDGEHIDPNGFLPKNAGEYIALELWQEFDSYNAKAFFTTYLWAIREIVKAGSEPHNLYVFASEVRQDKTIKNPGAVFRKKVKDFLEGKKKHL